jgi:arylsulfatase A-like enzyme
MTQKRPNVVLVFSDQQRADTLGCYKNPMGLTPNLDSLAEQGIRFENAFTNQPLCGPARSCLWTGKYATTTGVWKNGFGIKTDETTVAKLLKQSGYRTGYIGKWHLSPREKGHGFVPEEYRGGFEDLWESSNVLEFTSHPYEGSIYDKGGEEIRFKDVYRVDFLTERAVKFIQETDRNSPFFLVLSFIEPHQQNDWGRMVGPEGYAEKFKNPYVPADLKALPGDWQEQLPDYYGGIKRVDECMGKIVSTLKENDLFDNTFIIYMSDHGCHFKTRNTEYKRSCHESSIKIPLIMAGYGCNKPRLATEFSQIVDIAPTILDVSGLKIPEEMEGKSLKKVMKGHAENWENDAFIQLSEYRTGRAIRTDRWKYCAIDPLKEGTIHSSSGEYTEYQIYDLYSDPYELVNLAGRTEYTEIAGSLKDLLQKKIKQIEDRDAVILPASVYP